MLHILTPGNPAYAALKIGAIGSIFALRFAMMRKKRDGHDGAEPETVEAAVPVRRNPHPVSKKKKRRRRRPT